MYISINKEGNLIDIDNALIEPNNKYFCPQCKTELIIKNGDINAPHFSHRNLTDCDTFTQDMSNWHIEWQRLFPIKCREVIIEQDGEKHRADICVRNYIIEFQHSKISQSEFDKRNEFFTSAGYKIIWIFDFIEEYNSQKIDCYEECDNQNENGGKYLWKYPCKFMRNWKPKINKDIIILFQFTEKREDDRIENSYLEKIVWVINENEYSSFKRFLTSYYPGNFTELKEYIKHDKF